MNTQKLCEALIWYLQNDDTNQDESNQFFLDGRKRAIEALGLSDFIEPVQELLIESGLKILPFRDLPDSGKWAIAHYMCVDGAAWAVYNPKFEDWKWGEGTPYDPEMRLEMLEDLKKFMPRFLDEFGDEEFGYSEVSVQKLNNIIKENHPDYCDNTSGELRGVRGDYTNPEWASILYESNEVLQDGWTRFYDRVALGIEKTPVVWYT